MGTDSSSSESEALLSSQILVLDFDSVYTYVDMITVLVFIILTSYSFNAVQHTYFNGAEDDRVVNTHIAGYIILYASILLLAYTLAQNQRKRRQPTVAKPNTISASWVWILWLIYGVIFATATKPPLYNESIAFAQGILTLGLVLSTYLNQVYKNPMFIHGIILINLVLLSLPHFDSVALGMHVVLLLIKSIMFYTIFMVSELVAIAASGGNQEYWSESRSTLWLEIKIVQSIWILFVPRVLLIGFFFQLVPLVLSLYSSNKDSLKLPTKSTVKPPPSIPKKPTRKRDEDIEIGRKTRPTILKEQLIDLSSINPSAPTSLFSSSIGFNNQPLALIPVKRSVVPPPPPTQTKSTRSTRKKPQQINHDDLKEHEVVSATKLDLLSAMKKVQGNRDPKK